MICRREDEYRRRSREDVKREDKYRPSSRESETPKEPELKRNLLLHRQAILI